MSNSGFHEDVVKHVKEEENELYSVNEESVFSTNTLSTRKVRSFVRFLPQKVCVEDELFSQLFLSLAHSQERIAGFEGSLRNSERCPLSKSSSIVAFSATALQAV